MVEQIPDRIRQARAMFEKRGGTLRTGEALAAGIHPEVLYRMRDEGQLEMLARGLYRLADAPELGSPDLVTVSLRVPRAVVCMISALSFHRITTQTPHAVDIALPRGAERPRMDYPPINVYWAVERIYSCGIEIYKVDGESVRIYSPEKTIVDCFRYRNKLGLDTALEALRLYRERLPVQTDRLLEIARVCRMAKVIRPYLEGVL